MTRFIEGVQRGQTLLFPNWLDNWIGEDDLVRVIDLFVDELDPPGLGFNRTMVSRTGRQVYHPAVLLKLFIYGYLKRIPSSPRLEREAGRPRHSGMVGCNVQSAIDTETHIIVAHEVTSHGLDRD